MGLWACLLVGCASSPRPSDSTPAAGVLALDGSSGAAASAGPMPPSAAGDTSRECAFVMPGPPPDPSSTEARFWFSLPDAPEYGGHAVLVRGNDVFFGTRSGLVRLDWEQRAWCPLADATAPGQALLGAIAPAGTQQVIALFGTPDSPRLIRTSQDGGETWQDASLPAPPEYQGAVPSAVVSSQGAGTHRMFASFGGPTLDVSEDGGLSWTRLIKGGSAIAQGMALDSAQQTLWYIAEERVDRVSASWLRVSTGEPLATSWTSLPLTDWDANGVYVALADPHDPHAIYLGGEGRVGYLRPGRDGAPEVTTPWRLDPNQPAGAPYTYVRALWADPEAPGHVVFGGGEQGSNDATLLRSTQQGASPTPITFADTAAGFVRGIALSPDPAQLLVLAGARVYVLAR